MTPKEKAKLIVKALEDKKAQDVVTIDVSEKTVLCDYFVIASGRSTPQVKSFSEHVEEELEKLGESAKRRDGYREGRWVVLDYGDVIVHMFHDETRLFYHLERLWE